jgi:LuxR family transcriptional regulator, maltose regulon positive regulatory protein
VRTLAVSRPACIERVVEPVAPGRLRPPPLRVGVVERPRLLTLLERLTREQSLTVVSAPTGYGKTTLLVSWAAVTSSDVAWASVGSRDLDADGFWAVVAAALEQAEPRLRFRLRTGSPAGDRPARMATALGSLSRDLTLVLDGYEQATNAGVDADFRRFLELAPETLHVIVSTRSEPDLGLPLRRARGTAAELGARELSLDGDETAAVLSSVLGARAKSVDLSAVSRRTEGWPAGVYLAALAAQAAPEPAEALASFSGAARDVSDYLRLELLDAQRDEPLRSFLLESSVLERLSAPLCDALLRRRDSGETLRKLVRGGAFLVPVGGRAREYRYLQPVREFLCAELARVAPARVAELRRSAATACEHAGLFEEAAHHARREGGEEEAGNLLARHALELVRDGRTEHLECLLATRAGAAAARRRPALGAELHRFVQAGSDVPALSAAAERVATLSARLPSGQVRSLLQSTAQAARAYALLLSGSVAEAYEAGAAAYAAADPDSGAPSGQAAAVASLAASRLGLGAVAAPLSRASASALARRGVRSGTAAALAELAQAAVAEERGEPAEAERRCLAAVEHADEPPTRAIALLHLARLRSSAPGDARAALEEAGAELSHCEGAKLLEMLTEEIRSELWALDRSQAAATGELSPAEQRVLRLLTTRLTQREIANELYVSFNTVKTHARVIYRKLGVSSRPAAASAARALNLI